MAQHVRGQAFYRHGPIALKQCPAHMAVDIDVSADEPEAGAASYLILIEYLSGCNASHRSVVLHAPVEQTTDDDWQLTEKEACIDRPARTSIRFEFSGGALLGQLPDPMDPRVHLRNIAMTRSATIWFAGRPSAERLAAQSEQLRNFISLKDLSPISTHDQAEIRATRCGPFDMLTELSMPIADWAPGVKIRSRHAAHRSLSSTPARAVMTL